MSGLSASYGIATFLVLIFVILGLFRTIPGSFLPEEDQGYFITIVQLPDGASLTRTTEVLSKIESYFQSIPAVHSSTAGWCRKFVFGNPWNQSGNDVGPLNHWDTRKNAHEQVPSLIAAVSGVLKWPRP